MGRPSLPLPAPPPLPRPPPLPGNEGIKNPTDAPPLPVPPPLPAPLVSPQMKDQFDQVTGPMIFTEKAGRIELGGYKGKPGVGTPVRIAEYAPKPPGSPSKVKHGDQIGEVQLPTNCTCPRRMVVVQSAMQQLKRFI